MTAPTLDDEAEPSALPEEASNIATMETSTPAVVAEQDQDKSDEAVQADPKPAEVPESDATDHQESSDALNDKPSADHDREEEAEDDGGHVVEGDEDTVIY